MDATVISAADGNACKYDPSNADRVTDNQTIIRHAVHYHWYGFRATYNRLAFANLSGDDALATWQQTGK